MPIHPSLIPTLLGGMQCDFLILPMYVLAG